MFRDIFSNATSDEMVHGNCSIYMHNNIEMILQDTLYCAACDKEMRNEKAFATHQKSSKHLENVERLKELLREEEGMLEDASSDASGLFTNIFA